MICQFNLVNFRPGYRFTPLVVISQLIQLAVDYFFDAIKHLRVPFIETSPSQFFLDLFFENIQKVIFFKDIVEPEAAMVFMMASQTSSKKHIA